MSWTPRTKSIVFSSTTLVTSLGLLVGAVADTTSLLDPFVRGLEWGVERPLSDRTHALTFVAATFDEGRVARLEGVRIELRTPHGHEAVASAVTGSDGRAFFEVRPGGYFVHVARGDVEDTNGVNVWEDARRGLYFDADGKVYWRSLTHEQLERGGDVAKLGVRIGDERLCETTPEGAEYCRGVPAPGARVQVFRVQGEERGPLVAEFWADGVRDTASTDRSFEPNRYDLRVEYDGAVEEVRILLLCDMFPRFVYEAGELKVQDADCRSREPVAVL